MMTTWRTLLLIAPALLPACASTSRITTYPGSYDIFINGARIGTSPATVTLPNTTFGRYAVILKEQDREIYSEILETEYVPWAIVWPIFGLAAEYELDVSAKEEPPSAERKKPIKVSQNPAVNVFTDLAFQFLDRGFLLEAQWYLGHAIRNDPFYPDAMLGMALYHRQKGAVEETKAWLLRYKEASERPYPPPPGTPPPPSPPPPAPAPTSPPPAAAPN